VSDGESGLNEFIKFSFRSLSEMEPSGVSVEITKSCTNKDHCQSGASLLQAPRLARRSTEGCVSQDHLEGEICRGVVEAGGEVHGGVRVPRIGLTDR